MATFSDTDSTYSDDYNQYISDLTADTNTNTNSNTCSTAISTAISTEPSQQERIMRLTTDMMYKHRIQPPSPITPVIDNISDPEFSDSDQDEEIPNNIEDTYEEPDDDEINDEDT